MKTFRGMCPHCEDFREIQVQTRKEDVKIRKDNISIDAVFSVCQSCGKDFATLKQMEGNLEVARGAYYLCNSE